MPTRQGGQRHRQVGSTPHPQMIQGFQFQNPMRHPALTDVALLGDARALLVCRAGARGMGVSGWVGQGQGVSGWVGQGQSCSNTRPCAQPINPKKT